MSVVNLGTTTEATNVVQMTMSDQSLTVVEGANTVVGALPTYSVPLSGTTQNITLMQGVGDSATLVISNGQITDIT